MLGHPASRALAQPAVAASLPSQYCAHATTAATASLALAAAAFATAYTGAALAAALAAAHAAAALATAALAAAPLAVAAAARPPPPLPPPPSPSPPPPSPSPPPPPGEIVVKDLEAELLAHTGTAYLCAHRYVLFYDNYDASPAYKMLYTYNSGSNTGPTMCQTNPFLNYPNWPRVQLPDDQAPEYPSSACPSDYASSCDATIGTTPSSGPPYYLTVKSNTITFPCVTYYSTNAGNVLLALDEASNTWPAFEPNGNPVVPNCVVAPAPPSSPPAPPPPLPSPPTALALATAAVAVTTTAVALAASALATTAVATAAVGARPKVQRGLHARVAHVRELCVPHGQLRPVQCRRW